MKKTILLLFLTLLCLNAVLALEMTPEYSSKVIVKEVDSPITLTLNINNAATGTYNLYTLADLMITPSETFVLNKPTTQKQFTLQAKDGLRPINGYYSFIYTLNFRDADKKINEELTLKVLNLEDVIEVSSDTINPATGEVSFYVKNREDVTLKNISAEFSSVLFDVDKTFNLGPKEKLVFNVDVDSDKLKRTKAGVYVIESVFQTKYGEKEIEGTLYLNETKGIETKTDKSGILIRTETISKTNAGNVVEKIEITTSRGIIARLFTTFNVEPTMIQRNRFSVDYTWVKEKLNPSEAYVVEAKTNYIFPFLIFIVAILAILGFKRLSETKIETRKSVSHVRTKNGEFALKVTISVKAKKHVENVSVIDTAPAILKIYNKFGLIKPDRIDTANRRIHWNVGDLRAGEARVFSYILYSKIGVVGKLSLPQSTTVFEKYGKVHEVSSNQVFFMSDQVRH